MALLTPRRRADVAAALGTAWGSALLTRPEAVLEGVGGPPPTDAETTVARVLGARQVVQALAVRRWPHAGGRLGAVADGLHATSMLALAALKPRYRRAALVSAAVAVLLGVLEANAGEGA
jgi:hypothetical protein